jgi:hypothetical protein
MDFTPLCLEGPTRIKRRTTVAGELATTVLFTSGLQHFVETPDVMAKQPGYVRDFLRELPVAWEESRFLGGYPGKQVVFARRAADGRWWIAGFNGEAEPRTVEVSLAELKLKRNAALDVITDAAAGGNSFERSEARPEGSEETLRLELRPGGGFVAVGR